MNHRFEALGFRVHLTEDDGVWVATARRLDTGDAFGPPVPGDRADEAAESLASWLEWQHAHTHALQALQTAETSTTGWRPIGLQSLTTRRIDSRFAARSSDWTICGESSMSSADKSHGHIESH